MQEKTDTNKRIEIPPPDPYTREFHRSQKTRASINTETEGRRRRISNWEANYDAAKMLQKRRQYKLLSLIFSVLAVLLFFAVKILTPPVIVTLDGGEGTVIVDNERIGGRTGKQLETLKFGLHEIKVIPDDSLIYTVVPAKEVIEIKYSRKPIIVQFKLEEIPNQAE